MQNTQEMCLFPAFIFECTVLFLFYGKIYFPHFYSFYCCVICESVFLIALSSRVNVQMRKTAAAPTFAQLLD